MSNLRWAYMEHWTVPSARGPSTPYASVEAMDTFVKQLASVYDDPASYLDGAYYAVNANPGPQLFDPQEVAKLAGVDRYHPAVWTNDFGEGRVFALAIGHIGAATVEAAHTMRDTGVQVGPTLSDAARTPAFVNLLRRGTEWAATGEVTLPLLWPDAAPQQG